MPNYNNWSSKWHLLLIILILGLIVVLVKINTIVSTIEKHPLNCVSKIESLQVRGSSLAPLINSGKIIKVHYDYYDCHPVAREDVVAYSYAENQMSIIKIVKAIPGDQWRLEVDNSANHYQIIVNDEPLRNSQGELYQLPERKVKMLQLYTKNYPTLPPNSFLILGNRISGSLDATRFGLVGKNDILGKVEY